MSDATSGRLDEALAAPDESEIAGRRWFVAIVWLAAAIGLVAHGLDADFDASFLIAVVVFGSLAAWLHLLHRVHAWTATGNDERRVAAMLIGVAGALIALLALDPAHLVFLFGAFTLTFGFAPSLRFAAVASFVVTLIWVGGWIFHELPTGALATPFLVWGTLNMINRVMDRVTAQSIERRALLQEISETRAALAQSERERGVLAERERVAAEIHDTLAQGFTSIVLLTQGTAARIGELDPYSLERTLGLIEETARDNLVSSRRLVENLGPAELDEGSLIDSIEREAVRFTKATGVPATVSTSGEIVALGGTVDVTVLRVAQEALGNARKYARANRVTIELEFEADVVTLSIVDDGVGFDPSTGPTEIAGVTGGRGLPLMSERLEAVGGEIEVTSEVGNGTVVVAAIPIDGPMEMAAADQVAEEHE